MDCKKEETLKLKLKNTEIALFKSIIIKCKSDDKQIGFNNSKTFTDEEKKLIEKINKNIK